MRSVNSDLTWRDLKLILAASARKNDADSSGWEDGARKYRSASNADRYHFNHEYGFGVADAGVAVSLAEGWTHAPALQSSTVTSSGKSVPIPDAPDTGDPTTVVSELTLESSIGFTEFVEVNVAFLHGSFRDLEIELESPSGAVSELAVSFDTYTDYYDPFVAFVPLRGGRSASGRQDTWAKTPMAYGSCESPTDFPSRTAHSRHGASPSTATRPRPTPPLWTPSPPAPDRWLSLGPPPSRPPVRR